MPQGSRLARQHHEILVASARQQLTSETLRLPEHLLTWSWLLMETKQVQQLPWSAFQASPDRAIVIPGVLSRVGQGHKWRRVRFGRD